MKLPFRPINIVPLRGGFGNQLFCWAYGRALAESGHHVFFDRSESLGRGYALSGLIPGSSLIELDSRLRRVLMSRVAAAIPGVVVFKERQDAAPLIPTNHGALTFHWGYWQSLEYFYPIAELLRNELRQWLGAVDPDPEPYCAIHVRRGDYVTDAGAARTLGALPLDYYERSLHIMKERGLTEFRVYTDDQRWAVRNVLPLCDGVSMSASATALEDFRGIISGSAVILANSSFSWWAAFVGERENRPIIAPRKWFSDVRLSDTSITPRGWQRV